jgi:hypothetical protein
MIDAEKQGIARRLPLRVALARRKVKYLEAVAVRIAKIKRGDAARVGIPLRQDLGPRRGELDVLTAQAVEGLVHVADDDGDMLEPCIVAA